MGRAQQSERFHGGSRFERGLRRVVELLGQIVVARVHGLDRAGGLVDRYAAHLDAFRHAVRTGVSDLLNLVLHGFVECGDDLVPAGFEFVGGEGLRIDEFALHGGQQVSVGSGHLVVLLLFRHLGELGVAFIRGRDVSVFLHDAQHTVEAFLRLLLVDGRIPRARCRNDAGQHGGFGQGQVFGVLVEVRLCRGLDAVGATTEVDCVHVIAQHFALVLLLRDFDGQERFSELAGICGGFAQIIAFRILLRDGRTALTASCGQIGVQRSCDARQIDAFVGVEGPVFGCDDRVADVIRQYGAIDDFTVLFRVASDFGGAVGIVDGRFFGQREFFRFRDFRGDVHVCEQADSRRDEYRENTQHPLQDERPALFVTPSSGPVRAMRSMTWAAARAFGCVALRALAADRPWAGGARAYASCV